MLTSEEITELLVAITGLVTAIALLVRAFKDVHDRLDEHAKAINLLADISQSSSTKVLPPDNP